MDRGFLASLPIAVALLLVRFVAAEANYQRAQRNGQSLSFPPGVALRLTLRLGSPFMLYVAYQIFSAATTSYDRGLSIASTAFALGCLLAEPGTISTTAAALVQTSLFGLRRKQINWEGAGAGYIAGLREVLVIGNDGTTITHTQYHVGQWEFIAQLRRRGVYVQGVDPRPS